MPNTAAGMPAGRGGVCLFGETECARSITYSSAAVVLVLAYKPPIPQLHLFWSTRDHV
jgi:hypothetical protein